MAGPDPQLVREIILRHRGAALDDAWGRAEAFLASWADGGRDWNRDQDQVAALPGGGKLGTIVLKEPQNPLRRGARRRAMSLLSGLIDGDPHDVSEVHVKNLHKELNLFHLPASDEFLAFGKKMENGYTKKGELKGAGS